MQLSASLSARSLVILRGTYRDGSDYDFYIFALYGVKIRYPKEIAVDEELTKKALSDKNWIVEWAKARITGLRASQ